MWYIDDLSSTAAQPIRTRTNLVFMLNAQKPSTDGLCNVYTANSDTQIKIMPVGDGSYRLQLNSTANRYLTATDLRVGASVNWQALDSSSSMQKWKIEQLGIPPYPTAPTDYTYTSPTVSVTISNVTNNIPLHIFKVAAGRIAVVNVVKQSQGIPAPYCGCNGGYYDSSLALASSLRTYNIALNYGVPVGPVITSESVGENKIYVGDESGFNNGMGDDCMVYIDGHIELKKATNATQLLSQLNSTPAWVQGGASLRLQESESVWSANWPLKLDSAVDGQNSNRTAIVANTATNDVYLIVQRATGSNKYTVRAFRRAIQAHINSIAGSLENFEGIFLDGGGSSCLCGYNSSGARIGVNTTRPLCQIIYIKP